jgi:hypothetical protein
MAAAPDEVCCYPFFYRVPPIQLIDLDTLYFTEI